MSYSPGERVDTSTAIFPYSSASMLSSHDDHQFAEQLPRGLVSNMNAPGHVGAMSELPEQRLEGQVNMERQYDRNQDPRLQTPRGQGSPGVGDPMTQYNPEGTPRKRSKVSRACDRCRAKKVKCDATHEGEHQLCSYCKRAGETCTFSREPLKRGPSKGYIKDLAERLQHLEGVVHTGEPSSVQYPPNDNTAPLRRASEDLSSPPNHDGGSKKRTYSSISRDDLTSSTFLQRVTGYPLTHGSPQHSFSQLPINYSVSQITPNVLANSSNLSDHLAPLSESRMAPETRRLSIPSETPQNHNSELSISSESAVQRYFEVIHPTFPILPSSQTRLDENLRLCSDELRQLFYEVLQVTVYSFPGPHQLLERHHAHRVGIRWQEYRLQLEETHVPKSSTATLVSFQILTLLAIESNNRQSSAISGQTAWLANAIAMAYDLKLQSYTPPRGDDPDSDERLLRKIWWSLVIMDSWYAASVAAPHMIPEDVYVVFASEKPDLGEHLYHLIRLSIILGTYCNIIAGPTSLPGLAPFGPTLPPHSDNEGLLLRGQLERVRESLPESFFPSSNAPLISMCWWYLSICVEVEWPVAELKKLSRAAQNIVFELAKNCTYEGPLTHHFIIMGAYALTKLMEHEKTREIAEDGLNLLLTHDIAPSVWNMAVRQMITNRKQAGFTSLSISEESKVAAQGLRHLAELATADGEGREVNLDESRTTEEPADSVKKQIFQDLRGIIHNGYIKTLKKDSAR